MTKKAGIVEHLVRALEGATPADRARHLEAPSGIEHPLDRPELVPSTRDGYVVLDARMAARLKALSAKNGDPKDA